MSDADRRPRFPVTLDRVGGLGSVPAARGGAAAAPSVRVVAPATAPAARATPAAVRPGKAAEPARQRALPPAGVGLDSAGVRDRMVQRLRAEGLRHEPVLRALGQVPRHLFVDTALAPQAYEDTSLPIGLGQTISKPSVVARMLELLFEGANARQHGSLGRVLEIGTGCGYQAALLMLLSRQVMSVERLKPLHDRARANLTSLRQHHVRLIYGDGTHGHPPNAPYDSIVAAAGGDDIPPAWLDQLAVGGRLVAPRADARSGTQALVAIDRTERGYVHAVHETVLFVPLKSGLA